MNILASGTITIMGAIVPPTSNMIPNDYGSGATVVHESASYEQTMSSVIGIPVRLVTVTYD
jgi:hypothetical protein